MRLVPCVASLGRKCTNALVKRGVMERLCDVLLAETMTSTLKLLSLRALDSLLNYPQGMERFFGWDHEVREGGMGRGGREGGKRGERQGGLKERGCERKGGRDGEGVRKDGREGWREGREAKGERIRMGHHLLMHVRNNEREWEGDTQREGRREGKERERVRERERERSPPLSPHYTGG